MKIPHVADQLTPGTTTTKACAALSPCPTTKEAAAMRSQSTATREKPLLIFTAVKTQRTHK